MGWTYFRERGFSKIRPPPSLSRHLSSSAMGVVSFHKSQTTHSSERETSSKSRDKRNIHYALWSPELPELVPGDTVLVPDRKSEAIVLEEVNHCWKPVKEHINKNAEILLHFQSNWLKKRVRLWKSELRLHHLGVVELLIHLYDTARAGHNRLQKVYGDLFCKRLSCVNLKYLS